MKERRREDMLEVKVDKSKKAKVVVGQRAKRGN